MMITLIDTRKDSEIIFAAAQNVVNGVNVYSCNAIWYTTMHPILGSENEALKVSYYQRSERLQNEFKEYCYIGGLPYYWDRPPTGIWEHDMEQVQLHRAEMLRYFAMSLKREEQLAHDKLIHDAAVATELFDEDELERYADRQRTAKEYADRLRMEAKNCNEIGAVDLIDVYYPDLDSEMWALVMDKLLGR